jgi:hypothetical protein
MPRKPELSFDTKLIIWKIAATNGTDNYSVICKEVDRKLGVLRKANKIYENTPDQRTIKKIIELDIQRLNAEVVVAKLPSYVWHLRKDYCDLKKLAESIKTEKANIKTTDQEIRILKHFSELAAAMKALSLLQKWLSSYPKTSIFRQFLPPDIAKYTTDIFGGISFTPPTYFSEHFHQEFPDLDLNVIWTDPFPASVIDKISYLGNTSKFSHCTDCQACKDLDA